MDDTVGNTMPFSKKENDLPSSQPIQLIQSTYQNDEKERLNDIKYECVDSPPLLEVTEHENKKKEEKKLSKSSKGVRRNTSSSSESSYTKEAEFLVYNPFILKLIYSKTYYFYKIINRYLPELSGENHDIVSDLMINQYYTEIIINDIKMGERRFSKDRFRMDIYFCNFEYALFRLAHLSRNLHHEQYQEQHFNQSNNETRWNGNEMGEGYFMCEITLKNWVDISKKHDLMNSLIKRYITEFYFKGCKGGGGGGSDGGGINQSSDENPVT